MEKYLKFIDLHCSLAQKFYELGNFNKAILYALKGFEKIRSMQKQSDIVFYQTLLCPSELSKYLIEVGDLKGAVNYIRFLYATATHLLSAYPDNDLILSFRLTAIVRLAYILEQVGQIDKSRELHLYAYKNLKDIWHKSEELKYQYFNILTHLVQSFQSVNDSKAILYFGSKALKLFPDLDLKNPDTDLLHDIANILLAMGLAYEVFGDLNKTYKFYQKARKILLFLHKQNPKSEKHLISLATSYEYLGRLLELKGKIHIAGRFYAKYLNLKQQLYKQNTISLVNNEALAIAYDLVLEYLLRNAEYEKALGLAKEFLTLVKTWQKDFASSITLQVSKASLYLRLGQIFYAQNRFSEAHKFLLKAFNIWLKLYKKLKDHLDIINGLSATIFAIVDLCVSIGNLDCAQKIAEFNVKLGFKVMKNNKSALMTAFDAKLNLYKLGEILMTKQDYAKAKKIFLYLLYQLTRSHQLETVQYYSLISAVYFYLSDIYKNEKDFAKTQTAVLKALKYSRKAVNDLDVETQKDYALDLINAASFYNDINRPDLAKVIVTNAIKILVKIYRQTRDFDVLHNIGLALERLTDALQDRNLKNKAIALRKKIALYLFGSFPQSVDYLEGMLIAYYKALEYDFYSSKDIENARKILAFSKKFNQISRIKDIAQKLNSLISAKTNNLKNNRIWH